MLRSVVICSPAPFATEAPATPLVRMCVVDTGTAMKSAPAIVAAATISAAAPMPYVRCVLPIRSPTVTTIRFHPIIVPSPSAIATMIFTQYGM